MPDRRQGRRTAVGIARLLAVGFLLILLLPGLSTAKTSVTPRAQGHLSIVVSIPVASVPNVRVLSSALFHVTATAPGTTTRGGTQTAGVQGLSGTTVILPGCGVSPCTDSYRGAGAARLRTGDYAVVLHLVVTQPSGTGGAATGFDAELAVRIAAGWFVIRTYFSTGTNPTTSPQTVDLNVYLDLGTRTLPTLLATDVALDPCGTAARCP